MERFKVRAAFDPGRWPWPVFEPMFGWFDIRGRKPGNAAFYFSARSFFGPEATFERGFFDFSKWLNASYISAMAMRTSMCLASATAPPPVASMQVACVGRFLDLRPERYGAFELAVLGREAVCLQAVGVAQSDPLAQLGELAQPAMGCLARHAWHGHGDLVGMHAHIVEGVMIDRLKPLEYEIEIVVVYDHRGFLSDKMAGENRVKPDIGADGVHILDK